MTSIIVYSLLNVVQHCSCKYIFFYSRFIGDEDTKRPSRMQQPLNSELILTKEQLYDMFQQILGVKKFEHQILYNALMVSTIGREIFCGIYNIAQIIKFSFIL